MNADGTEVRQLTDNDDNRSPAWSPDGARIAFNSGRYGYNFAIFVMNADGTEVHQLTDHDDDDFYPA